MKIENTCTSIKSLAYMYCKKHFVHTELAYMYMYYDCYDCYKLLTITQ